MTAPTITRTAAAEELLKRRKARSRLLRFTEYTFPQYKADPFHMLLADTLERVVTGELTRLAIFCPPQHGKSRLVSVQLPAYWFGNRPDDPVILASYAASLAEYHSRQARGVVESQEYRALFGDLGTRDAEPIQTRRDSRSVSNWNLQPPYRGGMLAVGVGGPITGHGAMLGIIDDPLENWEQALSATYRDRAWDWYRTTFRTRIWERGAIVLVMTRWHADDLAGRILHTAGSEWTVLRLPAIAETQEERDRNNDYLGLPVGESDPLGRAPGEALSPSRYSIEELRVLTSEGNVGAIAFAAEYQGVPRAPEGNRFKRAWFPIVDAAPAQAKRVRYWDKAGSTSGSAAYTAGVLLARHEGITYVEHVVRGRWEAHERETVIKQTAEIDTMQHGQWAVKTYIEQEPGSGGKESAQNTIQNLAGFRIEADPPVGNKDARLEPFADQAGAGNVRLVRGHWNHDFIEEAIAVPNGAYRDQMDATAGAFNKLVQAQVPDFRQAKVKGR